MILFTKSTPKSQRNDFRGTSLDLPIVAPISVRKSFPAINRCNDVFPTSVSPNSKTLYFTSKRFLSLISFVIDRCISLRLNECRLERQRNHPIISLLLCFLCFYCLACLESIILFKKSPLFDVLAFG